jgi:hypothetical protein
MLPRIKWRKVIKMQDKIVFATDLYRSVRGGDKTITIRSGQRDYPFDKVIWAVDAEDVNARIPIQVLSTTVGPLALVEERLIKLDGFATRNDCLAGLQKFYPDLTETDFVTVVRFIVQPEGKFEKVSLQLCEL